MSSSTEALLRQFKALSDAHRLRIVSLCQQGEVSVSELTEVLGQSQPRVSQHLKQLCEAELLERFRDGKRVYYRQPPADNAAKRRLLGLIPADDPTFVDDLARLRQLRGATLSEVAAEEPAARAIHRALIEQTVAAPLGDLQTPGTLARPTTVVLPSSVVKSFPLIR